MSIKEDWRKLPTWGKVLAIGGAGFAGYVLVQGFLANSSVSSAAASVPTTTTTPTASGSGGSAGPTMLQIAQQAASAQSATDQSVFSQAYSEQQASFSSALQAQQANQEAFLQSLIAMGSQGSNVMQHAVSTPTSGGYEARPHAVLSLPSSRSTGTQTTGTRARPVPSGAETTGYGLSTSVTDTRPTHRIQTRARLVP